MSITNLEKYRKDLDALISESGEVQKALLLQGIGRQKYLEIATKQLGKDKALEEVNGIKQFTTVYQHWYSEALCGGQLIPDTTLSFSSARAGASPPLN